MAFADLVASMDAAVAQHLGDATQTFELRRFAGGSYVDGVYQAAAPTVSQITAAWAPVGGRELAALDEAQHGEELRSIHTLDELRTRDSQGAADRVVIDGEEWEIIRVEKHEGVGGVPAFYIGYAARRARP